MLSSVKQVFVGMDPRLLESLLTILVLLTLVLMLFPHSDFNGITEEDEKTQGKILPRFYLAISTVSTVGYGDISPKTAAARLVCIIAQLFMLLEIHSSLRTVYAERKNK